MFATCAPRAVYFSDMVFVFEHTWLKKQKQKTNKQTNKNKKQNKTKNNNNNNKKPLSIFPVSVQIARSDMVF